MSTLRKAEYIAKYGEEAYKKHLAQSRAYYKAHREQERDRAKIYREEHPEEERARNQEQGRKGGKRYDKHLAYEHTGLQGDRNKVRNKHNKQYRPYKAIIAPESQIHHEWIPTTDEYRGVALVEAEQHMHGFVDVIAILDGEITLLTEEEVKKEGGKGMKGEKKIGGKVTSWGIRLQVPAPVIKGIELAVDDEVIWTIEERKGKKVAVLSKKESEE